MEESPGLEHSINKRSQNNTIDFVVSEATFTAVTNIIPACSSYLESLRLDFNWILNKKQLSQLLRSLRRLFRKDDCSLNNLTLIFMSCYNAILVRVLAVCPTLKHLTLEIIDFEFNKDSDSEARIWDRSDEKARSLAAKEIPADLCLETLRVRSCAFSTFCPYDVIVSKCPNLRSLDLTGIYCTPELFLALADSNQPLKVLKILDSSLDEYQHQEIIQLLEHSELEELSLIDVGVGQEWRDGNKDIMESLVAAVKKVSTLRTLALSLNTLTGCTVTTAKLFEEPCPSQITELDLRRNSCRTEDLLKFAELLSVYKPTQRLELIMPFTAEIILCEPELRRQITRELSQYCDLYCPLGVWGRPHHRDFTGS